MILVNRNTGKIVERITSPAFTGLYLFDAALAPDNTFYVLGSNLFSGVIIHLDLKGDTLGTINLPVSDAGNYISPEGFGLDPRDGSFWVPLTNSGMLAHFDSSGNLLNEYPVGCNPNDAAVGPDGKIYISLVLSGEIESFDPSTGATAYFASSPFPINLTWSAAGDLWVGDIDGGAEEFNSSGSLIFSIPDFGVTAAEPALSGNIWDTNAASGLVNQYTSTGTPLTQTSFTPFQPGLAVLGDVPGEAPLPPPQYPVYSINLAKGQSASFVISSLNGKNVSLSLLDENGDVLSYGTAAAANYTQGINNFVAGTAGTYYVQVNGDPGPRSTSWSLATPTSIRTRTTASRLRSRSTATTRSWARSPRSTRRSIRLTTICTIRRSRSGRPISRTARSFRRPSRHRQPRRTIPSGSTWPTTGPTSTTTTARNFGDNTIYKLDPATGAVIAPGNPPEPRSAPRRHRVS